MSLSPGARLGTYEIQCLLGAGGMGEVYRALDLKLGREVAIKVLPEALAGDREHVARFEREARLLAALSHPGIATVFGAEREGDVRYIVMELVPGETLSEKLARGPMPVGEALRLGAGIAEALSAAHEAGVIHRDLKPANIKVTPDGRVKILDLGLAKALSPKSPSGALVDDTPTLPISPSLPGCVLGTPGYMSPEQARGGETDRRTDIWSFGCVLFQMLSGAPPFPGKSLADVLAAILEREPDWGTLPEATPPRVRELLARCLKKDASHRLRDAADIGLELEAALAGKEPRPPRRWIAAALLGGIVVASIGGLALSRSREGRGGRPGQKQLVLLPPENLVGGDDFQRICDGFTATVSARLQSIPRLGVVTPTEFLRDSDPGAGPYAVARSLGANLLLKTSFQRVADRLRVTWAALDVEGHNLAGGTLDGSSADLFDLQDRLSDAVARALAVAAPERRGGAAAGALAPGSEQKRYVDAVSLLSRYDRLDSVEKALSILSELASERPDAPLVQAALARTCLALFDLTNGRDWATKGIAAAEEARRLDPGLAEVDVTLGETLLKTGRPREAVAALRRALSVQPDGYDALLGLGRASGAIGEDGAAGQAFDQAIALRPLSWAGYNQKGSFLYQRGRYGEAEALFRRATELSPDSYRAWSNLGSASAMSCRFDGALEAFRRALAVRPNNSDATSNLGLTQLWTGRFAEAVATLEKAALHGPTESRIWENLGDAYVGAGLREKGAEAYGRALSLAGDRLQLTPGNPQALQTAAICLARTGRVAEAEARIGEALAIDPGDPDALANAAVVSLLSGKRSEALAWLRKAVDAGYCPSILERQPEFLELKKTPEYLEAVRKGAPAGSS